MNIEKFIANNSSLDIKEYLSGGRSRIYFICDKGGEILYIGRTKNIEIRMNTHNERDEFRQTEKYYFDCHEDEYIKKEWELIRAIKPKYNTSGTKERVVLVKGKRPRQHLNVKRIAAALKKRNLTVHQLAKKMGRGREDIEWALSSGHTGPKTLKKIAKALDLDPKDLVK